MRTIEEMEVSLAELKVKNEKRTAVYNDLYPLHITTDDDLERELQAVLSKLHRRIAGHEQTIVDYTNLIQQRKNCND